MASIKNVFSVFCALLFLVSHANGGFNFAKFSYAAEMTKHPAAVLYRNDGASQGESGVRKSTSNEEDNENQQNYWNSKVDNNDQSYGDEDSEKTNPPPNFYTGPGHHRSDRGWFGGNGVRKSASNKEDNKNRQDYWNGKVGNNDQSYENEEFKYFYTRSSPPVPSRGRSEVKQRQRYDDLADTKRFESSGNMQEQKHGMSDTRYLENGKYYYDIKSEIGTENAWDKNMNTERYGADDSDGEP